MAEMSQDCEQCGRRIMADVGQTWAYGALRWSISCACPHCGATMNHHADKPVEPTDARESALVDAAFGAVIHEVHGCPSCGNVESRVVMPC